LRANVRIGQRSAVEPDFTDASSNGNVPARRRNHPPLPGIDVNVTARASRSLLGLSVAIPTYWSRFDARNFVCVVNL
jgi:hypothetical protein